MIGVAFDGGFQHVKKARSVFLVNMLLVPQAGVPHLVPGRVGPKPRRRSRINDRLMQAACKCYHVPLDNPPQGLRPRLILNREPQERQSAQISGYGGFHRCLSDSQRGPSHAQHIRGLSDIALHSSGGAWWAIAARDQRLADKKSED